MIGDVDVRLVVFGEVLLADDLDRAHEHLAVLDADIGLVEGVGLFSNVIPHEVPRKLEHDRNGRMKHPHLVGRGGRGGGELTFCHDITTLPGRHHLRPCSSSPG